MEKINVIGAGPSGGYLSLLLAKNGFDVSLFEKRKFNELNKESCTGIVSDDILRFFNKKEITTVSVNKINQVRLFLMGQEPILIKLKDNFILDRSLFDKSIINKAIESGAEFYPDYNFKKVRFNMNSSSLIFSNNRKIKTFKANVVVGSDGPLSSVGKQFHLVKKRKFISGIQTRLRIKNNNIISFGIFNKGVWWVVPENSSISRVGLAMSSGYESEYKLLFRRLIENLQVKNFNRKISFSLLPVFNPWQRIYNNYKKKNIKVLLVGDAAGLVKQTSFGGIISGINSSVIANKAIIGDREFSILYTKLWFNLIINLLVRKTFNKMNLNDYKILKQIVKDNKRVFLRDNRDNLAKILLNLGIKDFNLLKELYLSRNILFGEGKLSDKGRKTFYSGIERIIPKKLDKFL